MLAILREFDEPVDAAHIASRTGLHRSTARFHLDALVADGDVVRTRISRGQVGRPRTGYRAVQGRLDYQGLGEVLALELGDTDAQRHERAQHAGRRWAHRLAAGDIEDAAPADDGVERAAAVFARLGFDPELTAAARSAGDRRQRSIHLHACPIRALAKSHPEVACGMHLGLLQGLLGGAPTDEAHAVTGSSRLRAGLEPFAGPELCIATATERD